MSNLKPGKNGLLRNQFSRTHLLLFVVGFALIGYVLFRTFASSPLVASLEAEQMKLPAGGSIVTDSSASGGKAVELVSNGTATGSVNFPSSVTSLTVLARGAQCKGAPAMTVALDGTKYLSKTSVSASSWTSYTASPANAISSGTHSLSISFTNAYSYNSRGRHNNGSCQRALYLDVTSFYGPAAQTPAPTVTLSATPTSVTAGSASTLTWTSTNATACTASGTWNGTEPTSGSVSTGALNTTSTYTLACSGPGGNSSLISATVTVSPASSSGGGSGSCPSGNTAWCSATNFPTPGFTPTRTVNVTSQSAFMTAWSNLQAGDQINVSGVTFTGQVNLTGKNLSNWAQINFDSATKFVGPSAATDNPAVYVQNDSHIRFYGGDISDSASNDQAGVGLLVHGDVNYVSWWNFVVHDTGDTAFAVWPAEGPSGNLDFKGEVYSWGHNLAWDPHAEKGTGEHGVNISDAAYSLTNSRVAVYAHDGSTGAGLEMGSDTASSTGNTLYMWCKNLTFDAKSQIAANCIQYWGQNTLNNNIQYLEAENLQGRPFDTNGVYSGQSLTTDTIEYGIASNTNLNPYLSSTESGIGASVKWDTRHGPIQLLNVSPLP